MDPGEREEVVQANLREYGRAGQSMRWIGPEEARRAEEARSRELEALAGAAQWCFGRTKADCRSLSPGCRLCGEGSWSCLFVNGVCNGLCFYCPSEQREVGEPVTNTLTFPRPEDYAAYLRRLGFRGASMSGGEPLLTFDRTVRFLEHARDAVGPEGHLWMYTNGILLTEEKLRRLAETGLQEIRVDLTATDYDLQAVRRASGYVSTVTVEIPAIPEDADRLVALLPGLAEAGARYLNLHELRATPYNLPRLTRRGYTFRHGSRVTVVGSELAALRALRAALERGIPLAVNYCSSVYKSLYQARAARMRAAEAARATYESVTPAGYIRELWVAGGTESRERLEAGFRSAGRDPSLWRLDGGRLQIHESLAEGLRGVPILVRYHSASLRQAPSYHAAFREIDLGGGRSIVAERTPVGEPADTAEWKGAAASLYEVLPEGLAPYF